MPALETEKEAKAAGFMQAEVNWGMMGYEGTVVTLYPRDGLDHTCLPGALFLSTPLRCQAAARHSATDGSPRQGRLTGQTCSSLGRTLSLFVSP